MISALHVPTHVECLDVEVWSETDGRDGVETYVAAGWADFAAQDDDPVARSAWARGHVSATA
jgi:hypothetical protein